MRATGKENARLISNKMMKEKDGISVTLCGGKVELMAKSRSVHICLVKEEYGQVSTAQ